MSSTMYLEANRGLVWRPEDAEKLRREHGVVGGMVGCIPEFKQQNDILGLPLELSQEEVTYIIEQGAAEPLRPPTVTTRAFVARRPQYAADDASDDDSLPDVWQPPARHVPAWRKQLGAGRQLVIDEQPVLAGERLDGATSTSAEEVAATAPWPHPANLQESRRYAVFRDLRSKGFLLTCGLKFGAHFLAYPGDPHLHHAQYTVRVVSSPQAFVPPDLAAASRAAGGAKKELLLAMPRMDADGVWVVDYMTAVPSMAKTSA